MKGVSRCDVEQIPAAVEKCVLRRGERGVHHPFVPDADGAAVACQTEVMQPCHLAAREK